VASCLVRDRLAHGHVSDKAVLCKSDTILAGLQHCRVMWCDVKDWNCTARHMHSRSLSGSSNGTRGCGGGAHRTVGG
jgi:hypothetical protein